LNTLSRKIRLNKFEGQSLERYQKAISQGRDSKEILQAISECMEFLFKSICIREYKLQENSFEIREPVFFLFKNRFFSIDENPLLNYPAYKHKIIYADAESIRLRGNIARHDTYFVSKDDVGLVTYGIKSILKWYFSEKYNYKMLALTPEQERIIYDLFKLDLEDQIREEKNKNYVDREGIIRFKKWNAKTNTFTPQQTDYFNIPLIKGYIKRIKCKVLSKSRYFRFGFKLLRIDGKLFGDGSIQSQDNNFIIHLGKNFLNDDLFLTVYQNGILQHPDKYTDVKTSKGIFTVELYIDNENFLYFNLNGREIYKNIINKEIREQLYMLAWGDGNEYNVNIEDIEIERCNK